MCPHLKERAMFLLKQEMLKLQETVQPIRSSSSTFSNSSCSSSTSSNSSCSSSTSSNSSCSSSTSSNSSCSSSTSSNSSCSSSSTASMSCLSSPTSVSITNFSARKQLLMSIYDKQHEVPEKSSAEEQLEKYLTSTSIIQDEEDDDILGYWREHQKLFPLISSIARVVLAIPASNTLVERLFSSCKNTIIDKRTRLGSEKLNKMMFLQKNMNILKEKFRIHFTVLNDDQVTKRRDDITILNHQSIQKKMKLYDYGMDQQNDNDYLINIDNDDDE